MKLVALTFLLAAQASAHATLRSAGFDQRQLQDEPTNDQICDACETCRSAGPAICNAEFLGQLACDNCEDYAQYNLCEKCTSCGSDYCDAQNIAEETCLDTCDIDITATSGIPFLPDLPCFSEVATVQVLNKGSVAMKDLKVGDHVMTEHGVYEPVYAFGHHHPTKLATFFQIHSQKNKQPLEVTAEHLVFLKDKSTPVPAQDIQVGDVFRGPQGVESTVTKIGTVQRQGIYAPITMNGSLLVDGVSASSYVRINGNKDSFMLTDHDLIHLALSPYRMFCNGISSTFCDTEFYHKESGMPFYAYYGLGLLQWLSQTNIIIRTIGISIILGLTAAFQVVENVFGASLAPLSVFILGALYVSNKKSKQGKAKVV